MFSLLSDKRKNRIIKKVFKDYISLDTDGFITFKGKIQKEINLGNISVIDGVYIVLELSYDVVNSKLVDLNDVPAFAFTLVKKAKLFNEDPNNSDGNLSQIFAHNYDFEKNLLKKHILNLESKNRFFNSEISNFNQFLIDDLVLPNLKPDSAKKINKDIKPIVPDNIKFNFDYLNKGDICYILDLNPDLTFEKVKVLRKKLSQDLMKLDLDFNLVKDASPDDLKKFLKPLKDLEKEKEIRKNDFKNLILKIKNFNSKSFSDIISSKEDYLKIYDEIKEKFSGCKDQTFNHFIGYHDYTLHTDELKALKKEIEIKQSLIIEFNNHISNLYLNYDECKKLKDNFKELNQLLFSIDKVPIFLKNKLFNENESLQNVVGILNDIEDYTNISDSNQENKIRLHNEMILDDKINMNKDFFKDMSDVAKKRAIVLDEKNVRIVAGAGTGKTYTIQKKVKYLIEKQGISPDKILCLCYTNKGTVDLDNKVNNDLDENNQVEVCTFHEFCRRVDRYCGGNKSTNRYLLDYIIRNYIKKIANNPEKISKITEYFSYYITPPTEKEFDTYEELLEYEGNNNLKTLKEKYYEANITTQTLQGEIVKSLGELIIANYLFMHEIDYKYERNYGHSFAEMLEKRFLYSGKFFSLNLEQSKEKTVDKFIEHEKRWERYQPDFYLPEYDIYIEHFGIGHYNDEKWLHKDYKKEMEEKISCHERHKTTLIQTFYYYLVEGRLIDELETLLKENNVIIGQKDQMEVLDILMTTNNVNDFDRFNKLIKSFINIFEAYCMPKSEFDNFKNAVKSEKDGYKRKRYEIFFDIISDIYDIYYEYNNSDSIDHNREISNALELIQSKKYNKSYDYVLIDEYQDINYIRCRLIQELQKNSGCNIFVVGDDWQSIYGFNGSDVNLFIDFDDFFPNSETIKLKENRRNSKIINSVTKDFILKNPNQLQKELKHIKKETNYDINPIKIVFFNEDKYKKRKSKILKLDAIIRDILKNNSKKDLKILLLGRMNNDINPFVGNALFKMIKNDKTKKILYSRNTSLDITFMTIHQSKGLEFDEVIVINFENKFTGFPSQIEDDPLLSFVKKSEKYPFAEERRLLYVALTRTLNNVYLLSPEFDRSIFIDELIDEFNIKSKHLIIDRKMEPYLYEDSTFFEKWEYHETDLPCPNCDDGKITIVVNNERGTKYVRCSNDTSAYLPHYDGGPYKVSLDDLKYVEKCPQCRGILVRHGDVLKCCLNAAEGCMESKELNLDKEDKEYNE